MKTLTWQNPGQHFVAQELIKIIINYVAELRFTNIQWNHLIGDKQRLVDDKYVLSYVFLGTGNGREKIFTQLEHLKDIKLLILNGAKGKFRRYAYKGYAGPMTFVQLYRDAEFIVTDTFHGMLFAIVFEKPFIVLDKSTFGVSADRMVSTLQTLGISDRYVNDSTRLDSSWFKMDYSNVRKILNEKREFSKNFLKEGIKDILNEKY